MNVKMNTLANKMLNTYGQAQVNSSVASASPHKLISMLYEGALVAVVNAGVHMTRGDVAAKGASLSKAIAIIDEGLKISVDLDAGGELAQNLTALYEYMSHRLLIANLKNDRVALDEVERLLRELRSAWDAIGVQPAMAPIPSSNVSDTPPRVAASYGKF